MPNVRERNRYPNNLRSSREAKLLTRGGLAELTKKLSAEDAVRYVAVTFETIKALEGGWSKPRLKTMATLAVALQVEPAPLFPLGGDLGIRRSRLST